MRSLLTLLLNISAALFAGILILLFSIRTSSLTSTTLKASLASSHLYEQLAQELNELLEETFQDDPVLGRTLTPLLQQELTPVYFRTKTEALIDDTKAWLSSPSATPPTLSFSDLKTKLLEQNPRLVTQLTQFAESYENEKPAIQAALNQAAQESGEDPPVLPDLPLKDLLQSDFTLAVGQYLPWVKTLYTYAHPRFPLLCLIFLALLALITLLNLTRPFPAFALTFLTITLLNLPPYLLIHFSPQLISRHLPTTLNLPLSFLPWKTSFSPPISKATSKPLPLLSLPLPPSPLPASLFPASFLKPPKNNLFHPNII